MRARISAVGWIVLTACFTLVGCGGGEDAPAAAPGPDPTLCTTEGEHRECYTGPAGTVNVGSCSVGVARCTGGVWGACVDEQTPTTEWCDGRDNDCDGTVDDEWVAIADTTCAGHVESLGGLDADTGSGSLGRNSYAPGWFSVYLREASAVPFTPLSATIELRPGAGTDFDLAVYCAACGGTEVGSSNLSGTATDTVHVKRADTLASWDHFTVVIRVLRYSATACAPWSLTITGNTTVPDSAGTCN